MFTLDGHLRGDGQPTVSVHESGLIGRWIVRRGPIKRGHENVEAPVPRALIQDVVEDAQVYLKTL